MSHFTEYQLLELALCFSVPRVDTNPIAHRLLEKFDSVKGIFDASPEELCRVEGVGENTAIFLQTVLELMRRYERDLLQRKVCYNTLSSIASYLHPYFSGLNRERLYMMLFNNRMNLMDCVLISEGAVNCTSAQLRPIVETAFKYEASAVVMAHNHPNGLRVPSPSDIEFTEMLNKHLNEIGIVLLEHLVFADQEYQPIMLQQHGTFRTSPVSKLVESGFYDRFYDVDEEHYLIPTLFETENDQREK